MALEFGNSWMNWLKCPMQMAICPMPVREAHVHVFAGQNMPRTLPDLQLGATTMMSSATNRLKPLTYPAHNNR